jgi:hypothetical protein
MPKHGKRAKGSNFLSSTDRGRSHDVNRDQEGKGHSQTIGHRWRDNSGYQEKAREEDGVMTLHCKSIFFEPLQSRTMAHDRPLLMNSELMRRCWRACTAEIARKADNIQRFVCTVYICFEYKKSSYLLFNIEQKSLLMCSYTRRYLYIR